MAIRPYDFDTNFIKKDHFFGIFCLQTKITIVCPLFLSFSSKMYNSISNIYIYIYIFHIIWPWEQCDFDNIFVKNTFFVIFSFSSQNYDIISVFLSFSSKIYNSISTHFIDFPQSMTRREVWFQYYFCKKRGWGAKPLNLRILNRFVW